jgi:hypothetical protein
MKCFLGPVEGIDEKTSLNNVATNDFLVLRGGRRYQGMALD